jgi:hypothetical protein
MVTRGFYLNGLLAILLTIAGSAAFAGAGQVQNMSGTLTVQRPDGAIRILGQKSEVNPGDVLTTQKDSYAQINMTDGSSMTLRPNTQVKIENYQFVQEKPQEDNAFFRLVKGGLRTVTGLVGKRGNQDAYRIGTATATIGIRGSGGATENNENGDCQDCGGLARGVYHHTYTGAYALQNESGTVIVGEGEFAYVKDKNSPIQVTQTNPGMKLEDFDKLLVSTSNVKGDGCVVR